MPKLNYKPANLRGLGTDFQLKPGSNNVPDEVWAKWEKDGEIVALCESGMIEVEGAEAPAPKRKAKGAAPKAAPKPPPPPPAPEPEEEDDEGAELSDAELEQLAADAAK